MDGEDDRAAIIEGLARVIASLPNAAAAAEAGKKLAGPLVAGEVSTRPTHSRVQRVHASNASTRPTRPRVHPFARFIRSTHHGDFAERWYTRAYQMLYTRWFVR